MKPVAFLRGGWRKKDSKSSSPSSSSPSTSITSSPSSPRPSTSSVTSILPMQYFPSDQGIHFPQSTSRKQADTRSDIYGDGRLGQIMPVPGFLRQRTHSADTIVTNFRSTYEAPPIPPKPRRPRRPPPLDLSSETSTPNDEEEEDFDVTPRPPFSAPLVFQTPKKAACRTGPRSNRSDMELDGVWKGFLAELEEEFDFLDMYSSMDEPPNDSRLHRRCFSKHHNDVATTTKRRAQRPHTSPQGDSPTDPSHSPRGFYLPYSNSTSSLPTFGKPPGNRGQVSTMKTSTKYAPTTAETLSLFPSPPPLNIRRGKAAPKPLVLLPTPSIAALPPSPALSTPDTTPVATPTTPRFCQSPNRSNTTRDVGPPVSILKKKPTTTRIGHSSPEMVSSPAPSVSGLSYSHGQLPPIRPLRLAQSASHIHIKDAKHPALHKATYSDSRTLDKGFSREPQMALPLSAPLTSRNNIQPSYLQSKGRTPPLPSHPRANIRWGYAV